MKILKAETTALRAFLQFNSWSEARNHGLPDHDGKAVNSLLGFARQILIYLSNKKTEYQYHMQSNTSSAFSFLPTKIPRSKYRTEKSNGAQSSCALRIDFWYLSAL